MTKQNSHFLTNKYYNAQVAGLKKSTALFSRCCGHYACRESEHETIRSNNQVETPDRDRMDLKPFYVYSNTYEFTEYVFSSWR
jgi:hypothetical protein